MQNQVRRRDKVHEAIEGYYLLPDFDKIIVLVYLHFRSWLARHTGTRAHWIAAYPERTKIIIRLFSFRLVVWLSIDKDEMHHRMV